MLGLKPGDGLPPPILQPPPLFPPFDKRPLDLSETETDAYLLMVKQEIRQGMLTSPYHLQMSSHKKDIKRYSDRYVGPTVGEDTEFAGWLPDWSRFPTELHLKPRRRRKRTALESKYRPQLPPAKKHRGSVPNGIIGPELSGSEHVSAREEGVVLVDQTGKKASGVLESTVAIRPRLPSEQSPIVDEKQLGQHLVLLEKSERREEEEEEEGGPEALEEEEEYYDEEIEEEGTDYNLTYFDPGEEYMADDDDPVEEGPYYS